MLNHPALILVAVFCFTAVSEPLEFDFTIDPETVNQDFLNEGSQTLQLPPCELPDLPAVTRTFLLPPDTRVEEVTVSDAVWEPLPGFYNPFAPLLPSSGGPFPEATAGVIRQGSALGYSVASLYGCPLRYMPSNGTFEILVSANIEIHTAPSPYETLVPERESILSGSIRRRGIESMVSNPCDLALYTETEQISFGDPNSALSITEFPSLQGDCVDMVIITTEELSVPFQEVADYRTSHGIITIVRTVQWIDEFYSGCDTQEKIRNFLVDAHQNWGIQAVLLGGDAETVPVRYTGGWDYIPVPYPLYQLPSDDYYGDLDGDWSYDGSVWRIFADLGYLDICTGRWPVNSVSDVETLYGKLLCYETPQWVPGNYARRILLLGSNNPAGSGADDMALLAEMLQNSAVPKYLDDPVELYYPHDLPAGDLNRNNALDEFDEGYNLIFHAGHSEIHKLGTAGNGTLGQFIWDSDFATMENTGKPCILWTLGCDAGHFDGAYCFSEAGMLTSSDTGLLAVISNPRGGMHNQKTTAYFFCDALFNTGYVAQQFQRQALNWPLSFLGEAFRTSKNLSGYSFIYQNLLGSPMLNVWRDNPDQLHVSTGQSFITEGEPTDITATVTDGTAPVEGASVVLWKKDELFAIAYTDETGSAAFNDVAATSSAQGEFLHIAAVKFREETGSAETTVTSFLPGTATMEILQAQGALVSLSGFAADPDGDGTANPGETASISITAINTGGETAQNITAQLGIASGGEFISSIPDDMVNLPDIPPDSSAVSSDRFTVEIAPDATAGSTVEFQVLFTGSGFERQSPLFLTIQSSCYELVLLDPQADNSSGTEAVITLEGFLMANTGMGMDDWMNITVNGLIPDAPFTSDTVSAPGIPANTAEEIAGQILVTVTPDRRGSNWLREGFPGCFLDITVESPWGTGIARHVSVEEISQYQSEEPDPPYDLKVTEIGENTIDVNWTHQGIPEAEGYYAYLDGARVFPVPLPVQQLGFTDLEPGTVYEIQITAIDVLGRESPPETLTSSTGCPQVQGWPLLLGGSPGAGALACDLDEDGKDEIAVISSFGSVYVLERNGIYQQLMPPDGYDYDRFTGLAAGDVTGDGKTDIVAVCQRKTEVMDQEQISILLFSKPDMVWTAVEIAVTEVNEELASTLTGGTPLLFQADNSQEFEIALRTRGNNSGTPHLYVWKRNQSGSVWEIFSDAFPMELSGGFFDTPSAADLDGDGIEELITTSYSAGEQGTEILVVDFEPDGEIITTSRNLYELNTGGLIARAFGTLAVTDHNGTFYIAGAAKPESYCGEEKKLFVCTVTGTDSLQLDLLWQTDWLPGRDFYGNMPGPALASIDTDPEPEVIYLLNGGLYQSEGIIEGFDLTSGTRVFQSELIPFNPLQGGGGADIRSQSVAGLTSSPGSGVSTVFTGFSTLCSGMNPLTSPETVPGFPVYSRDAVWSAPVVCDLNGDAHPEVLNVDNSGYASLYNMDQYTTTGYSWPMYQANPRRTGFLPAAPVLDLQISGGGSRAPSAAGRVTALVTISGADDRSPARTVSRLSSFQVPSGSAGTESSQRTVTISAFAGDILCGTTSLPLSNGCFETAVEISRGRVNSAGITLKVDPENRWIETDETNNTLTAAYFCGEETVIIPSPSSALSIHLTLPDALENGIAVNVYSTDGRLVEHMETGALPAGDTTLELHSPHPGDHLPSGMYTVRITGLEAGERISKVIVLN